ncbi:malectin domain-containing carbohydrate-binding protein [Actibacterium sp. D379-3]
MIRFSIAASMVLFALAASAASAQEQPVISINAAGPALTQGDISYAADRYFTSGEIGEEGGGGNGYQANLENTVYFHTRWGRDVGFEVPLPPASYMIEMAFAEGWHSAPGGRAFDIVIEDQVVARDLDPLAEVGGDLNQPLVTRIAGANPGMSGVPDKLEIRFVATRDNAIINAIRIFCMEPAEVCSDLAANGYEPELVLAEGLEPMSTPPLLAINAGGAAISHDGVDYVADAYFSGGETGAENGGPNGPQPELDGTPFKSLHLGREFSFSAPVASSPLTVEMDFVESWFSDAGRRVIDIEIEGQPVLSQFDIVDAAHGDSKRVVRRRFIGIDPAAFGAADHLDIRFAAVVDNALVNTIRVYCEASAEICAEQAREAEEQRAAKAQAELLAAQRKWFGIWGANIEIRSGGIVSSTVGYARNEIVVAEAGIVADILLKDGYRCNVAFAPSEALEDAQPIADTCGSGAHILTEFRLEAENDNQLRLHMKLDGNAYWIRFQREISGAVAEVVRPTGFPFETASFTLEETVAATQEKIAAAIEPENPQEPWTTRRLNDGGWLHQYRGKATGGLGDQPEEWFMIIAMEASPEAKPVVLIRRWAPKEADRPLYDTLITALEGKYGPPSHPIYVGADFASRGFDVGRIWAFDPRGEQIEKCDGKATQRFDIPTMRGLLDGFLDRTPDLVSQIGCGTELLVMHNLQSGSKPIEEVQFALVDHGVVGAESWLAASSGVAERIETLLGEAEKVEEQQQERESVAPKL